MATDIIDLTNAALVNNQVDGFAVVLYIQPVPDIQTFTINGQRLVCQGIGDHQGNQFLGEMIGPIVVGAAGDSNRKAIGAVFIRR